MASQSSNGTGLNATCLPFNPGQEFRALQETYGQIDRYLFRLSDKCSRAQTDKIWVKSPDARRHGPDSHRDVFTRRNRTNVAQALRRHLHGQPSDRNDDNLVSWSSSLLSVLHIACWRVRQEGNDGAAEQTLCVVDTTLLPPRVFMRDLFLIRAFLNDDTSNISPLAFGLRLSERLASYQTNHYGEYFSQGALRIEGCCSIVRIAGILATGFYVLRPELNLPTPKGEGWNNSVIKLREEFYSSSPCPTKKPELDVALRIGDMYGSSWKVPIALAFLALRPRIPWEDVVMEAFRELHGKLQLLPLQKCLEAHIEQKALR